MGIFASLIAIMAFANATPSAATGETDTPSADAGATETSVFGTVYAEIFATQTAAAHTPTPTMSDGEATISAVQTNVVATIYAGYTQTVLAFTYGGMHVSQSYYPGREAQNFFISTLYNIAFF